MLEKILDWWYDLKAIWKILIILGAVALVGIVGFVFNSLDLNGYDRLGIIFGIIIFGSLAITILVVIASIRAGNSSVGNGSNYSSGYDNGYAKSSSYSSGSSSSDSSITEQDIVDALRETLHSKGTGAVAIYYSPFVSQWYMVDYWGQKNHVTYVRTGYGETDYFEGRFGERYPVSGILNRDQIYYYSK